VITSLAFVDSLVAVSRFFPMCGLAWRSTHGLFLPCLRGFDWSLFPIPFNLSFNRTHLWRGAARVLPEGGSLSFRRGSGSNGRPGRWLY
jgi:hypothetical protein